MQINKHVSLNLNVRGLGESATLAINERSAELKSQGRMVYRLGLGQSPFPVPAPVVESLRHHAHEKDYLPPRGLRELRGAVAEFHRNKDGVDASPTGVLIGPGSKELMFLLQLVYYGELLVPTPCWGVVHAAGSDNRALDLPDPHLVRHQVAYHRRGARKASRPRAGFVPPAHPRAQLSRQPRWLHVQLRRT